MSARYWELIQVIKEATKRTLTLDESSQLIQILERDLDLSANGMNLDELHDNLDDRRGSLIGGRSLGELMDFLIPHLKDDSECTYEHGKIVSAIIFPDKDPTVDIIRFLTRWGEMDVAAAKKQYAAFLAEKNLAPSFHAAMERIKKRLQRARADAARDNS